MRRIYVSEDVLEGIAVAIRRALTVATDENGLKVFVNIPGNGPLKAARVALNIAVPEDEVIVGEPPHHHHHHPHGR